MPFNIKYAHSMKKYYDKLMEIPSGISFMKYNGYIIYRLKRYFDYNKKLRKEIKNENIPSPLKVKDVETVLSAIRQKIFKLLFQMEWYSLSNTGNEIEIYNRYKEKVKEQCIKLKDLSKISYLRTRDIVLKYQKIDLDSLIEQPKKTKKTADEVLIDACEKLEIDPQYKQAIQDEIKKFHEIGNN